MSVGNLKDYGNKGNNFPWQLKVLEGLQCICDRFPAYFSPQTFTPVVLTELGSGAVPLCYGFSISNIGGAPGLINGNPLPAGAVFNFPPLPLNNTYSGVSYDATGTTFLITYIV
jgi:hypothetical protein